nr:ribonuclease H-like domain-containing protein [Tanacetum cinerariifolium]
RRYKSTITTTNSTTRSPQMVSSVKPPILKKVQMTKDKAGNEVEVSPVTTQQILARTRERKSKSTLFMAISDERLARFHGIKDAKTLWAAIKTRFGESTNSTNELNAAYSVSTATCHSSQAQDDLEEMDLKWQVAMLSMRVNRFYKKTGRKLKFSEKEPVGFDKTKVECFNYHRRGHFARNCRTAKNLGNRGRDAENAGYKERDNSKRHLEEEASDFALMAFTSNPSSSSSSNSEFNEKEVLFVKEEEVTETMFDNRSGDEENSLANDRFKKGEGFHAVSLPLTGNYMPPKPDLSFVGLDDSIYKFKISETVTSLSKDVKDAPKTSTTFVEKPKEVRTNAPLIQEWDTNGDNDSVFRPKHIPAKINFVKAGESVKPVKSAKQVKPVKSVKQVKPVKSVKHVKRIKPVKTAEQTEKSKNFNRMAKKSVLPNNVGKGTGHKESRPVWNNVQKINYQNKFASIAVFTRFKRIPVSAAKLKAATSTSAAKPVNTARPKQSVNFTNSRSNFHKSHSPIRRSFYNTTTHLRSNSTERVNTAGSKAVSVSVVKGNGVTAVKASAGCVWRPRVNEIDQISKDYRWICTCVDYGHPHQALKNKRIVDSGCSRHMIGNKAYLDDYQEINDGGFVAFGSSRVNTACYVLNRALVTKPHNKTPYELLNGRSPRLDFIRPFGCPVTILNTLDPFGKFKGNQTDKNAGPQDTNGNEGTRDNVDAGKEVSDQHHIVLPLWSSISFTYKSSEDKAENDKPKDDTGSKIVVKPVNKEHQAYRDELDRLISQEKEANDAADSLSKELLKLLALTVLILLVIQLMLPDTTELRSTGIFTSAYDDDLDTFTSPVQSMGAKADFNNIESSTVASPIPIHRVHIDHPKDQILEDPQSAVQTKGMAKKSYEAHAFVSYIHKQRRSNHNEYENCLFAYFLSQMEPKKVAQALDDKSWVEAMQDELLQFSLQKV